MRAVRQVLEILSGRERRSGLILLGLMLIGMGFETIGLSLVLPVMALLLNPEQAVNLPQLAPLWRLIGQPSTVQFIIGGVLTLVLVYAMKGVYLTFLAWRQAGFVYSVQAGMSQRLFDTYLRQPYPFHLRRNSAQLIRNATSELEVFTSTILNPGTNLVTESLVVTGITALLVIKEPLGAGSIALIVFGFGFGFRAVTRTRIAAWGLSRQQNEGQRLQQLMQGLGGAKEIKLLGREREFLARYRRHSDECARVGQRQATMGNVPRLGLEVLAVSCLAALVLTLLAQGRDMATIVPALGLFAAAAFRLVPAANRVLSAIQGFPYAMPVLANLHAEFSLPGAQVVSHVPKGSRPHSVVALERVAFSYPEAPAPALVGVTLEIRHGTSIGLMGPSGAGKSTLVDLLLGLLSPTEGRILVDGDDIQQNLRRWQDEIGYVPQTIYLTDDTLRRNVAFGLPDAEIDDAAVWRAVQAAQLMELLAERPTGLDTYVGERGVRLSGGQRQRIGIARALYHDPALLVLDEATSALDESTEREVMLSVNALHGAKTLVIVAHRRSALEHCDAVYRVERGTAVLERGDAGALRTAAATRA